MKIQNVQIMLQCGFNHNHSQILIGSFLAKDAETEILDQKIDWDHKTIWLVTAQKKAETTT